MRIPSITPVLALVLLTMARPAARAAEASAEAAPASGTEIHLVQRAERIMSRDRLHAALRIEAAGIDPREVQTEVNRRMGDALTRAKREASVKAETGSYVVYLEPDKTPTAPGKWRARQTLLLTGKDFGPALGLIGELQGAGMLLEGITFDLAPDTLRAAEDALTAEALADLRARANRVAAAMGMTVARYKSIDVGNASTWDIRPMARGYTLYPPLSTAAVPPPQAEAGESTIGLMVQAEVILTLKGKP